MLKGNDSRQPEMQSVKKTEKAEQVNTILPDLPRQLKIFGALFNTFILIEYDDQLLMVDQHAVHERLLFDRMMQEYSEQHTGQELLVPIVVSVSPKEQLTMDENRELLESNAKALGIPVKNSGNTKLLFVPSRSFLARRKPLHLYGKYWRRLKNRIR